MIWVQDIFLSNTLKEQVLYHSIHFTRGLASLLVLAAHLIFYLDSRIFNLGLEWDIGTQGVEVFFVISGFVMLESLNKRKNITPKDFIISRIIRIVPGYWLVSLVKLCVAILAPSLILLDFSWINIVKSFFFLFSRNLDGNIETFYGVGWTLNYEMFFYILIFFLLLIEKFSFALLVSVLAICAYLSTFNFGELHDLGVVFSVLLVNFIWGLIISRYKHKYKFNVILNSFLFFISVVAFMANLKMEYLGVQYALLVLTITQI